MLLSKSLWTAVSPQQKSETQKASTKKHVQAKSRTSLASDDPYEAPEAPEVHLHTDQQSLEEEVNILMGLPRNARNDPHRTINFKWLGIPHH